MQPQDCRLESVLPKKKKKNHVGKGGTTKRHSLVTEPLRRFLPLRAGGGLLFTGKPVKHVKLVVLSFFVVVLRLWCGFRVLEEDQPLSLIVMNSFVVCISF